MDSATTTPEQDTAVEREEALSCRFPPSPVFRRDNVRVVVVTAYMCRYAELPTRVDLSLVAVERDGRRRVVDRSVLVRSSPRVPAPWPLVVAPYAFAAAALALLLVAIGTANYALLACGAASAWFSGFWAQELSTRRSLSPPP